MADRFSAAEEKTYVDGLVALGYQLWSDLEESVGPRKMKAALGDALGDFADRLAEDPECRPLVQKLAAWSAVDWQAAAKWFAAMKSLAIKRMF